MEKTEERDLEGTKVLSISQGHWSLQNSSSYGFDPTTLSSFIQRD